MWDVHDRVGKPLPGPYQSVWVCLPGRFGFVGVLWITQTPDTDLATTEENSQDVLCLFPACVKSRHLRADPTTHRYCSITHREQLYALYDLAPRKTGGRSPMTLCTAISFTHSHLAGWWHRDILNHIVHRDIFHHTEYSDILHNTWISLTTEFTQISFTPQCTGISLYIQLTSKSVAEVKALIGMAGFSDSGRIQEFCIKKGSSK